MKKLSTLLHQRDALLQQARLANLAYAYQTLGDVAARIARAQLGGRVALAHAAPADERYCPTLTALEGSQSVIEEHFTEEDILELADTLAFVTGHTTGEVRFSLEDFGDQLVAPLRAELIRAGVRVDEATPGVEQPGRP